MKNDYVFLLENGFEKIYYCFMCYLFCFRRYIKKNISKFWKKKIKKQQNIYIHNFNFLNDINFSINPVKLGKKKFISWIK